jgi:hypothetical protein
MFKLPKKYIFIDESGDASFYSQNKNSLIGRSGFQPLLILGMIILDDKPKIYHDIVNFQNELKKDPLYNSLPCIKDQKGWYLHARTDQLEIRAKFIEFLRKMENYRCYVVIGRKRLSTFQNKHNNNENEFYFDLVYHLLKDRLNNQEYYYQILLSSRTGNDIHKLKNAIDKAILRDNKIRKIELDIHYDCRTTPGNRTPEISIVDYLLWSLQRYILSNDERYYKALEDKYNLIIDLYDFANYKTNYYSRKNRFDKSKASEFKLDGYVGK